MNAILSARGRVVPRVLVQALLLALFAVFGTGNAARGADQVLYETGFEVEEGFQPDLTLIGQGGWVGYGSPGGDWGASGNGLVTNFFAGRKQQGFVGFSGPTNNGDILNVWRPVNHKPLGAGNPSRVLFTVTMSIEDSASVTNRDDFRWSVYNAGGDRLFTLDFDNDALGINYLLDDDRYVPTGRTFTNGVPYRLELVMEFAANRWSATLDGGLVVTNLPITTRNAALDLGDVDAVWAIRKPGSPGDNFMVFDDYRLVAMAGAAINPPPRVEARGQLPQGGFVVRVHGTPGSRYVVQSTADFQSWSGIKTNAMPADGYFDHLDEAKGGRAFYRAAEE